MPHSPSVSAEPLHQTRCKYLAREGNAGGAYPVTPSPLPQPLQRSIPKTQQCQLLGPRVSWQSPPLQAAPAMRSQSQTMNCRQCRDAQAAKAAPVSHGREVSHGRDRRRAEASCPRGWPQEASSSLGASVKAEPVAGEVEARVSGTFHGISISPVDSHCVLMVTFRHRAPPTCLPSCRGGEGGVGRRTGLPTR